MTRTHAFRSAHFGGMDRDFGAQFNLLDFGADFGGKFGNFAHAGRESDFHPNAFDQAKAAERLHAEVSPVLSGPKGLNHPAFRRQFDPRKVDAVEITGAGNQEELSARITSYVHERIHGQWRNNIANRRASNDFIRYLFERLRQSNPELARSLSINDLPQDFHPTDSTPPKSALRKTRPPQRSSSGGENYAPSQPTASGYPGDGNYQPADTTASSSGGYQPLESAAPASGSDYKALAFQPGGKIAELDRSWTASEELDANGAIPEEERRSYIIKALEIAGVPATEDNIDAVNTIVWHESEWKPWAQNNWDENATVRHTPSKGLMQAIQPTFDTWALEGFDTDIFDPLQNMVAAIRYGIGRYGSLQQVPGVVAIREGRLYEPY